LSVADLFLCRKAGRDTIHNNAHADANNYKRNPGYHRRCDQTMRSTIFTIVLGLLFGVLALLAQVSPSAVLVADGLKELNQKYHEPLTTEALLRALFDEVQAIRTAAAFKLVELGRKDAIPQIVAALERERVPAAQVSFATAAVDLGAGDGFNALRAMCQNSAWTPAQRMGAAQQLSFLNNEECLEDVLGALRSQDLQAAPLALSVLGRYQHMSKEQCQQVRATVEPLLTSDNPAIKVYASDVLAKFGDDYSSRALDAALAVEKDESARTAMAKALVALASKSGKTP
jgi:HEAT repeat protein